ncbi:MAG: 50S ribosome-binding GTPase, partial [Anaerolineae bacterium]|nr:50S ribosome-binding GTPase [Anaerolineae bacterium]
EGAGQVAVIGPPNVGKSSLVTALTNAAPEVADYPFTTQRPLPGMMPIDNIQIQLIDTPPLCRDFDEPQLFDLIRRVDLILLVIDLQGYPLSQLEESLALLEENHILPLHMQGHYEEVRRTFYKPLVVLVNKTDSPALDEDFAVLCELLQGENDCPLLPISAFTGRNLDVLQQTVYDRLNIIRIYSKPPGMEPDFSAPFVLSKGSTVEEFAGRVHKDFLRGLKSARVWGSGAFDGQKVSRDYVLQEGDIVELQA